MQDKPKKIDRILVLFDVPYQIDANFNAESCLTHKDWKDERDVVRALKKMGYDVHTHAVFDNIQTLIDRANSLKPDIIFVLAECFNNDRDLAPNIVATLDLLGIKYTGPSAQSLLLCKDKALSKKILNFEGIKTPKFVVSKKGVLSGVDSTLKFPVITKPIALEGSEGISLKSINHSSCESRERAKFIFEKYNCESIVEEFVPGRELYFGVIGDLDNLVIFPPRELVYRQHNPNNIATFKAKWDNKYRKKHGIKTKPAVLENKKLEQELFETCKKIYKALCLSSYARIDLRITESNEIFFLEANPNPSIARIDDFAKSAEHAKIGYEELINSILDLAG